MTVECQDQRLEEVEDASVGGVVLADGLVIPEQVDERHFALRIDAVEKAHVLVGGQRILIPTLVGEAQRDVVAQLIRAQQQLHVSLIGVAIEVSRALPAEDVACAFGEDDTITCIAEPFTDFVRVDDLRVAEGDRFHTESVHQELFLQLHLFDERAFVVQRGDAVGESTAGDFHAASGDQLFETVDDFKADLRKNLEAQAERRAEQIQEEKIIEKAVENMTVDVPPVMIEDRITHMINEFTLQLQSQGMDIDKYLASAGIDMDKLREDYREAAKKNLLADMMLEEVAKVENLKVNKAELDFEVQMMAMMYRTSPKQIEKILKENRQMSSVAANVLRRKAMQFIFDNRKDAKKVSEENKSEETKTE